MKSEKLQIKNKNWRRVKLGEIAEIIDGDRGVHYPSSGELFRNGYCLFLNTKNVPGIDFDFSEVQFITKEKDDLLRSGKMQRGDFVLTTRGTVGNIAYYGEEIPYKHVRINSGMVILRPKREIIEEKFFYLFLISQEFKRQIEVIRSGSAQPQLPIRDLKLFEIKLPPIDKQKKIIQILFPIIDKIK
ncbi:MAG: restriction endonuclease subunit S, partial [Spirochaetes bacterium]